MLLEELDKHMKQQMWFQQDGASPHFHLQHVPGSTIKEKKICYF